jgi:hypothetical protein
MVYKTVTLSDGLPCRVRQLGLYELDRIKTQPLGPYTYTILTVTGQVIEDTYDLSLLNEPPVMPATDNPQPGTYEWKQLQEYETYLAAIAYESKRLDGYAKYEQECKDYIIANCLSSDDGLRIVEPSDWHKIYMAALVPQVTEEGIAQMLRDTFQGFIWEVGSVRRLDSYFSRYGAYLVCQTVGNGDN